MIGICDNCGKPIQTADDIGYMDMEDDEMLCSACNEKPDGEKK